MSSPSPLDAVAQRLHIDLELLALTHIEQAQLLHVLGLLELVKAALDARLEVGERASQAQFLGRLLGIHPPAALLAHLLGAGLQRVLERRPHAAPLVGVQVAHMVRDGL